MKARKLLTLLAVGVLTLSLAGPAISAGMGDDIKGTVTKIDGNHVTIKSVTGDEKTVEPANPEALGGLKVGDQAMVKDGKLTKAGGAEPSAPSPGSGY